MLLEFKCSNFRSIRNEVLFSYLAGKDHKDDEIFYKIGKLNILPLALVYGANGSGKSNFAEALLFVQYLVGCSLQGIPGGLRQMPHKLDGTDKESTFCVQFIKDGMRYAYGFSLIEDAVNREYLYYFPANRKVRVFERNEQTHEKIKIGKRFRALKELYKKETVLDKHLLASYGFKNNNIKELRDVYNFFCGDIVFYSTKKRCIGDVITHDIDKSWLLYSLKEIVANKETHKRFLMLLNRLNVPAVDFQACVESYCNNKDSIANDTRYELTSMIQVHVDSAKVDYGLFQTDLLNEESSGVQKLFTFLVPFFEILDKGKLLICDELESNLHEILIFKLLEILYEQIRNVCPQMLIITHNSALLSASPLRKDQVWFTELRKEDRSTDLYSLAEIKNVRNEEDFGFGYISGKYGAVPFLANEAGWIKDETDKESNSLSISPRKENSRQLVVKSFDGQLGLDEMKNLFDQRVTRVRKMLQIAEDFEKEGKKIEATETRKAQIPALASALDFYLHGICKFALNRILGGKCPCNPLDKDVLKTKNFDQELNLGISFIARLLTEKPVQREQTLIDYLNKKSNSDSYLSPKAMKRILSYMGLDFEKILKSIPGNRINGFITMRNKLVHQDGREYDTAKEIVINSSAVNKYIDAVEAFVNIINNEASEIEWQPLNLP